MCFAIYLDVNRELGSTIYLYGKEATFTNFIWTFLRECAKKMIATRRLISLLPATLLMASRGMALAAGQQLRATPLDTIGQPGVTLLPESGEYSKVVVWMHGLGDTAHGWAELMPMLEIGDTKFVLPTAPERPITLNGGYRMPGWSDIYSLSDKSEEDRTGFEESAQRVTELIQAELDKGVESKKIIVGGFSQGGALALHVSLRAKYKLAGCCALSTWLPLREDYPGVISEEAKTSLKLFQAHGEIDEVVQYKWGRESHDSLKEWLAAEMEFMPIPGMGHSSDPSEVEALRAVIQKWLA